MGYRLGAEERFAPRDLTNLIPSYDPAYAHRTTDKVTQYAREQEERSRLLSQLGTEEIIKGPIKAYQAQADRNRAAAESDQQMRLRDRAGALTEEQIKSAAQARGLSEKFGEREREAQIGAYEQQMNAAQRQLKNAEIEGTRLEEESKFLSQPAAQAGFKDAQPNETIRGYQLRAGIEGTKDERELRRAQIQAAKEGQVLNSLNAQIAKQNLDEAQRTARVRDLTQRMSMTDDPQQAQVIAADLAASAKPAEYAEAVNAVRSNKLQSQILREEMERRDPRYGFMVNRMTEASDTGSQIASIVASADNAVQTYGSSKTPWSDDATDAVALLQTQLKAAGFTKQADDLNDVVGSGFDIFESRQDRMKRAVNNIKKSLGVEYGAKYGHLGQQFADFGKGVQAQGYGLAKGANGKAPNVFLGQQSQSLQVPLPTAPNLRQQAPQLPQMQTAQPNLPPAQPQGPIPVQQSMPRGPQPQRIQQPMQQTPMPAPQAPQFQLPPSFKPVRQLGQQ